MKTKNISQRIVCLLMSVCTMFTLVSTALSVKPEAKSKEKFILEPNVVCNDSGYLFKRNDDGEKTITILGISKNIKTFAPPEKIKGYTVTRLGENDGNSYSMVKRVYQKNKPSFKNFAKGLYNGLRYLLFPVEKVLITLFLPIMFIALGPVAVMFFDSPGSGTPKELICSPHPLGLLKKSKKVATYTCKSVDLSKVSKNLTVICDSAFEGLGNKKAIKGCDFSKLKYIGKNAFVGCKFDKKKCKNLNYSSVETIGENAFAKTNI